MNRAKLIRVGVGLAGSALVLGGAGWWAAKFFAQRGLLDSDITWYEDEIQKMERDLAEQGAQRKRLGELAAGALGVTEESVSASLRSALNAIADECGLAGPSVATQEAQALKNPSTQGSATAIEFARGLPRGLRDRPDFWTMSATLQGTGTLEQAMRALVTVQSQAWASRVDSVSLTPVGTGKNRGARVNLTLKLTTVFVPDVPLKPVEALWTRPGPETMGRVQFLVAKNAFREPMAPAPEPVQASAPPPPEPAPGQPYGEWRVTAIVRGRTGPELWLVNERTGERLMLSVGQTVMDAVFVGSHGEGARLRIGNQEYEIALSQTLQDRRVVNR
ncbi:MAG: hypothetical protein AB7K52_01515 [Phycisphaerales bacterium]